MENKILDFSELERGKIYIDVLSNRPVLITRLFKPSTPKERGEVIGIIYNPTTGLDEKFETSFKRLTKADVN